MKKAYLLVFVLLFASFMAQAKPVTLSWTWPPEDCNGDILAVDQLTAAEIIIAEQPMPMPSDTEGKCVATDPDAPEYATVYTVSMPNTSATPNLPTGRTYYARIRVANASGWSNWSEQKQFEVLPGKPGPVIWLN